MDSRVAHWIVTGNWPKDPDEHLAWVKTLPSGELRISWPRHTEVHDPTGTWTPAQKQQQYDQLVSEYEDGL